MMTSTVSSSVDSEYPEDIHCTNERILYRIPRNGGISWVNPSSLQIQQEWKAVPDNTTGYYYFYHKYTRETSWLKPDTFREWQAIRCISGDICYYNVLARKIAQIHTVRSNTNRGGWQAIPDKATGYFYFFHNGTKETTWDKPDVFNEWEPIRCITSGEVLHHNILSGEISSESPPNNGIITKKWSGHYLRDDKEPRKVVRKKNAPSISAKHHLFKSLEIVYPEVLDNELILRKLRGREIQAIHAIQTGVANRDSSPFDEARDSILYTLKLSIGIISGEKTTSEVFHDEEEYQSVPKVETSSPSAAVLQRSRVPTIYMSGRNDLTIEYL